MNYSPFLLAPLAFALVSCGAGSGPMTDTSFNPLNNPSSTLQVDTQESTEFVPGEFIVAVVEDAAFYKDLPQENQDADKLLARGTGMKVVSARSSYVKVELDSGEVGYVPQVMVSGGTAEATDLIPVDGVYEVYPPIGDLGPIEPLPAIDPDGLPLGSTLPAVVDPDAPIDNTAPKLDKVEVIKPTPKKDGE